MRKTFRILFVVTLLVAAIFGAVHLYSYHDKTTFLPAELLESLASLQAALKDTALPIEGAREVVADRSFEVSDFDGLNVPTPQPQATAKSGIETPATFEFPRNLGPNDGPVTRFDRLKALVMHDPGTEPFTSVLPSREPRISGPELGRRLEELARGVDKLQSLIEGRQLEQRLRSYLYELKTEVELRPTREQNRASLQRLEASIAKALAERTTALDRAIGLTARRVGVSEDAIGGKLEIMHEDVRTAIDSSQALTERLPSNDARPQRIVKVSATRRQPGTELDAQARNAVCTRLCAALSEAVGARYSLLRIAAGGAGASSDAGADSNWQISTCTNSKRPAAQCPNDELGCESAEAIEYVTATCVAGR